VYLPSHGASARHGVQCSGVWNADYWLRWRRRCWHSKRRDCFEDVAAEACEHERSERDGFKPNWQRRRRVAVAVDRPAVCHHSAACVCSLCTVNSIPRAAGRPVFDKRRRRAGSVSTRSTTALRCPSPEHALIRRTFVHVVGSRVDERMSRRSLIWCQCRTERHYVVSLVLLVFVSWSTDVVGMSLKQRFYQAKRE